MKKSDLEKLVKENTNDDGVIDFDTIGKGVNDFANGVRDKAVEKAKVDLTESVKDESINGFLKDFDFENKDQFSAFVKNGKATSDEVTEKANRYRTERNDFKAQVDEIQKKYDSTNGKLTNMSNMKLVSDAGAKDAEYVLFQASKLVDDKTDLAKVLETFTTEKPEYFTTEPDEPPPRFKVGGAVKTKDDDVVKGGFLERFNEMKEQRKF